jgi:glycosyltransferase involved in cell wall biosynthesis
MTTPSAAPLPITAVVLTRDERRNLPACLESVAGRVAAIVVVDCFSTDETLEIAKRHGARVYQRAWRNYADQFQWALDHAEIDTEFVLRLDADERWTDDGFRLLAEAIRDPAVAGVNVRMRIQFMGRFLRHGGLYPNLFLRVFRREGARIEQRWMDEHITVPGKVVSPPIDVIEANYDRQENIGLWTTKHNAYSTREAVDGLIRRWKLRELDSVGSLQGDSTHRRRWMKEHVYARVPLFVRPFLYFFYRYFLRLGFLDGIPGFVFHVLQAFWYRFLVDVKVYQLESLARASGRPIAEVIKDSYGIEP